MFKTLRTASEAHAAAYTALQDAAGAIKDQVDRTGDNLNAIGHEGMGAFLAAAKSTNRAAAAHADAMEQVSLLVGILCVVGLLSVAALTLTVKRELRAARR